MSKCSERDRLRSIYLDTRYQRRKIGVADILILLNNNRYIPRTATRQTSVTPKTSPPSPLPSAPHPTPPRLSPPCCALRAYFRRDHIISSLTLLTNLFAGPEFRAPSPAAAADNIIFQGQPGGLVLVFSFLLLAARFVCVDFQTEGDLLQSDPSLRTFNPVLGFQRVRECTDPGRFYWIVIL